MARRNHSHDGDSRGRKLRFEALEERAVLAGDFELLKDINVGGVGSSPSELVEVGGVVFFTAYTNTLGTELWRSDGTANGTVLVKDITPGSGSSSISRLTNVNGTLFFHIGFNIGAGQLWKSDGTEIGTIPIGNAFPQSFFANVGGVLYFQGTDGIHGGELWKSDGTANGTVLVKDIRPGGSGSFPAVMVDVGGVLYFTADDGVTGRELWRSDGTATGTMLVKDLRQDQINISFPSNLVNVGGILFFTANEPSTGYELWKSDGTNEGTVLVKDIRQGTTLSNPGLLTPADVTLYFTASDGVSGNELWKSDGTTAGTVLVKDIRAGAPQSSPRNLIVVGDTLYFRADDGVHGIEVWKSDGSSVGTSLVKDINPGSASSTSFGPSTPGTAGYIGEGEGTLYFRASDGIGGYELWRSDGTETGTVLVKEFIPGSSGSNPDSIIQVGNRLYVVANTQDYGREIWVSKLFDYGDYNRDTLITPADHTFWAANFGATSGVGLQADGNNNGVVDAADYNVWRDNYTPPPAVAVASSAVSAVDMTLLPQPSSSRSVAPRLLGGVARVAESPQRREALLIAARDAAFVELQSSDSAPCGPLAHGSESDDTEQAARDGVFELLGRGGL